MHEVNRTQKSLRLDLVHCLKVDDGLRVLAVEIVSQLLYSSGE
jgi:hypothetical protein